KKGWYDGQQVSKLLSASLMMKKEQLEEMDTREQSMRSLGLNLKAYSYVGQEVYSFVTWGMVYNGVRQYLMFEPKTKIWIRAHKLDDVFKRKSDEPELWPFVSWATHYDTWNFWSKAPADDVYPIHDAM